MYIRVRFLGIFALIWLQLFVACKKEEGMSPQAASKKSKRMVLVYMEANNDLKYDALNSIDGMEQGAQNIDGVLLVYVKTANSKSHLLKIKYDSVKGKIASDTVKNFDNEGVSTPEFVKSVVDYSQQAFPASSYGLILWSHATSWAPPRQSVPLTKSFGSDRGSEMDIIDLKNALPNNFNFIIFDACSMASLEVLYEFKDKAKYIIASPSETIAESYPYQNITPYLFQGDDALNTVAQEYFDYYNAKMGLDQSATVSLVKTDELQPLAQQMNALIQKNKRKGDELTRAGVQRMDFSDNSPIPAYDFGDFLAKNFNADSLASINSQLNQTILFKAHTKDFLGVGINSYSGLACYIPYTNDENLEYYRRLQWYQQSGLSLLFN